MSLKTKTVTIEKGRDKGKKFEITEMPVAKIDNWAMRVLLALAGADVEVAEANEGMMGLAKVAFAALGKIPPAVAIPLMDELLECVQFIPDGGSPRPLDLELGDVQDFTSIWILRKEVFNLHIDFLQQEEYPT